MLFCVGTGTKPDGTRIVASPMWLARDTVKLSALPVGAARRVAVGVPARDEAADITPCLAALDDAAVRAATPIAIIVGANNCADATAALARSFAPRLSEVIVDEVRLPPERAHAGGARRYVMDRAADLVGAGGVVMTTDADSRVDGNWIAANLGEIAGGADAVAGVVAFDDAAREMLPELRHRAAEWHLAALHARLEHMIDPRPHDPWPRHIWAWGASLALTVEAYRMVGGVPLVALAEDRALADAVERAGLRLRRSHAPLVYTSPRQVGRAPGGFADLLASHADPGCAVRCRTGTHARARPPTGAAGAPAPREHRGLLGRLDAGRSDIAAAGASPVATARAGGRGRVRRAAYRAAGTARSTSSR